MSTLNGPTPARTAVTISDVAARAGASRATVSYALTDPDRLSSSMLERVRAAIDELGYVRNAAARQLRVGRSHALAFIVSNVANPFFNEVALGAEDEAARRGHFILLANSHDDPRRERDYVGFFEAQQVSGILITPVDEVPTELVELGERGTPFVLIGEQPAGKDYPSISGDNALGGYLATSYLIERGRKDLLFAGSSHANVGLRRAGALRAVREAGRDVSMEFIGVPYQTAGVGEDVARELLSRGRDQLPDGIVAGNDLLALGILHGLITGGVRVPDDVSLVGYDDIEFAEFAIVPLTTIRHPGAALGASAVQQLLGVQDHESRSTIVDRLAPRLVVRST